MFDLQLNASGDKYCKVFRHKSNRLKTVKVKQSNIGKLLWIKKNHELKKQTHEKITIITNTVVSQNYKIYDIGEAIKITSPVNDNN